MSRQQLIEAARRYPLLLDDHLKECDECRDAVALLSMFPVSGHVPLPDAPAIWVARASAIAQNSRSTTDLIRVVAKVTFDSWLTPLPMGVRGPHAVDSRRIRVEAEGVVLDVRAEHHRHEWTFVGQIIGIEKHLTAPILVVSGKKLLADSDGFVEWSSRRPPEKVTIQYNNKIAVLSDLSWKMHQSG